MARYENPIKDTCTVEEGQVFIADVWRRPEELCESAWKTMSPFVMGLAHGAEDFYEGGDEKSALGDDFVQRRVSSGELPAGSIG